MENRTIVSTPLPDDPPLQVDADDFDPPETGNPPLIDDKSASPPFDIDDTPPSAPPGR